MWEIILLPNQLKESEVFFSWIAREKYFVFHVANVNQSYQFINMLFCREKFSQISIKNNKLISQITY